MFGTSRTIIYNQYMLFALMIVVTIVQTQYLMKDKK